MRTTAYPPLIYAFALLFAPTAMAAPSADEKALTTAVTEYEAAYNARDLEKLLSFWAPTADYMHSSGKIYEGKDKVAALFERSFSGERAYKITLKVNQRKFLKPDLALDDGVIEFISPDGRVETARYATIWAKADGKWLITNVRDMPREADPAMPARSTLPELEWLLGDWTSGEGDDATTMKVDWALDKQFIKSEYKGGKGELKFTVLSLIGWDPIDEQVYSWFFDSRGGYGEGAWARDGDVWRVASTGTLPDGREATMMNEWIKVDANTATWKAVDRVVDGNPIPDAESTFKRKTK